jgi:hypothetical protein
MSTPTSTAILSFWLISEVPFLLIRSIRIVFGGLGNMTVEHVSLVYHSWSDVLNSPEQRSDDFFQKSPRINRCLACFVLSLFTIVLQGQGIRQEGNHHEAGSVISEDRTLQIWLLFWSLSIVLNICKHNSWANGSVSGTWQGRFILSYTCYRALVSFRPSDWD